MKSSHFGHWSALAVLLLGAIATVPGCSFARDDSCRVVEGAAAYRGIIDGKDVRRPRAEAVLRPVVRGCGNVVDIQFLPGSEDKAVLLDQAGTARWIDFSSGKTGDWLTVDATSGGEKGLLGLAFHPKFSENGQFFLNWTAKDGGLKSRVARFAADPKAPFAGTPTQEHVVYEVEQPYGNHNAGGLAFGPDGMLYIGWGDGGAANDPHDNGQNGRTALGTMVRLDVDTKVPYAVPADNPWVGSDTALDEVWAIGLRNPWRYSFDDRGRLVIADVGQNKWEEVTFLTKGSNAGWNTREGTHCFDPGEGCPTEGLLDPMWDYSHSEGQSVTGGYQASAPASLKGRWVFGDFASGRIWALALPDEVGERATDVAAVGRFPVKISTFGRDASGRIYLSGYDDQTIYRLDAE